MNFREIASADIEGVIALWATCGLTRPWNDPRQDIEFAMQGKTSTVLLGEVEGRVVSSVMVGS